MRVRRVDIVRAALLVVCCSVFQASAATVTWEAVGTISTVSDPGQPPSLAGIGVGTPWTLDITFDPATTGVHNDLCDPDPTYRYDGAISTTRFALGGFSYTNAGGEIFTNADLPVSGCGSDGLVQFQWINGWTGGAGGPDLNGGANGFGVLVASYFDPQACNGSLPITPGLPATPCPISQPGLAGLEFDSGGIGVDAAAQFTSGFSPYAVPEPATLGLLGIGLSTLAWRKCRRQS